MRDEGKLQFSQLTAIHIAYVQKCGGSSVLWAYTGKNSYGIHNILLTFDGLWILHSVHA